MEIIIQNIKKELIEKKLTSKYNKIFYDKKIMPLFQKKDNIERNNINEDNNKIVEEAIITNEKIIVEYDKRGKIKKSFKNLLFENEKNKKEIKNKEINNNKEEMNIKTNKNDNNILFIETLPLIIADYLQTHKNYAVVEIEEELSKELDLLFNKDLLIKINEYDELVNKFKNYNINTNIITKELKQYSLQMKQIQKNIKLYEQIIVDKKMKGEKTIFLEDMLSKLIEKETFVQQKINERKQNIYSLNSNEKNNINIIKKYNFFDNLEFSSIKNLNYNPTLKNHNNKIPVKITKLINESVNTNNNKNNTSSILITSQTNNLLLHTKNSILNNESKKIVLKSELTEEKIQSSLTEIFLYYSSIKSEINDDKGNEKNEDIKNKYLNLRNYYKFCYDFKIHIPKVKINEIFKKNCNNNVGNNGNNETLQMNFNNFKSSLLSISLEMNSLYKQKLIRNINEKKNIINYMELKEIQRQEEEKNHNKFTEKITGGTAKKGREKSQYEYISKHKQISEEITKYELDYEKECKRTEKEILNNFYKYLGIPNYHYKNKLRNIKSNYFLNNFKNNYSIIDDLKSIDNQRNKMLIIKRSKSNLNNNLILNELTFNKNNFKGNIITNIKKIKNLKENNILKISAISNQKITKSKIFENSNKINWNQMQNIYFEYNPIYPNNNEQIEIDNVVEIIKKSNNNSKNENKLIKNNSAFELKGINIKNILPPIISNNNLKMEKNLRYYDINNSTEKTIELKSQNKA